MKKNWKDSDDFDVENWLWKSEFCDLHDHIHNESRSSTKDLLKLESAYFHSIDPGIDAEVDEKFLNGVYLVWSTNVKDITISLNNF